MEKFVHKYFVKGDDLSIEEIEEKLRETMIKYTQNDPTCEIKFVRTLDKEEKGRFPGGNYEINPLMITITKHGIEIIFYPNIIKRFGSLKGAYFVKTGINVIKNGVIGMIDILTKAAFRRWQYYRFMKTFGFDTNFACSEELCNDVRQYISGKVNDIGYECTKVIKNHYTRL